MQSGRRRSCKWRKATWTETLARVPVQSGVVEDPTARLETSCTRTGRPSTGRPWKDRIFDLRVEDSPQPITELTRLVRLQRAYRFALRGEDLASVKNWDQAISSYRKAVELAPEKEELRYGLATILLQGGRDEESLPIFRQVFREHPVWVEITKRNVISGDLPNDPARIQRILDQAVVRESK